MIVTENSHLSYRKMYKSPGIYGTPPMKWETLLIACTLTNSAIVFHRDMQFASSDDSIRRSRHALSVARHNGAKPRGISISCDLQIDALLWSSW
jgi:hypothetical protein